MIVSSLVRNFVPEKSRKSIMLRQTEALLKFYWTGIHIATLSLPVIWILKQIACYQSYIRIRWGENADNRGAPSNFTVEPFKGVRAWNLAAVQSCGRPLFPWTCPSSIKAFPAGDPLLLQNPVAYFQKILYHSSWPLSFPFVSVGTNILDFSMAFFYPILRTLLYTIMFYVTS